MMVTVKPVASSTRSRSFSHFSERIYFVTYKLVLNQAWYKANLQIAIPVTVAVGIVLLLLIWGIYSCTSKARCAIIRKMTDGLRRL